MKTESNVTKLSVLEERVNTMCKQNNLDHAEILKKIEEVNEKLDKMYVMRVEIEPIKKKIEDHDKIFCTIASIIILTVLGAILKLVIF